jgi:predicted dienelactone hydrolase
LRVFGLLAAVILAIAAAPTNGASVGFEEVHVANAADKPLTVGIWYPSDAPVSDHAVGTFVQTVALNGPVASRARLPLIVMSHGTGGWYGEHYDTALALARVGFVVASLSHTGDTYDDRSRSLRMKDRPAQLHRLIDFMTGEWAGHARIDPRRIGAFGFSSGGFTVLVAIGGVPDLGKLAAHCRAHPTYFDCALSRTAPSAEAAADRATLPASVWIHDPRIKAAVVAAPALGFTFGSEGLKTIHVPVQLWRAENDHILPNPEYAEAVRLSLPTAPDFHLVPGADHFDFLAPCNDLTVRVAPQICRSVPGFDRAAFHADFNGQVVSFFAAKLR